MELLQLWDVSALHAIMFWLGYPLFDSWQG